MTTQPTVPTILTEQLADQMFKDRKVRRAIVRESHLLFFHFYFAHYVTCATAPFHFELFSYTEDETITRLILVAFRGSSKSTLMTMSYPLWAILGRQQKKFVLMLCQTRIQAKQHMMNLKRELEGNTLLKNDLGPFQEENDEWGSFSLVFSRLNARITAASREQSIRGLRHHQHRPDVIIGDDLEDLPSTRTHEERQKTFDWLTGEILPAGDRKTRLILVGNYLHEDSLLMRLKNKMNEGAMKGVFRAYPLVQSDGTISWTGMYPDMESIEELKKEKGVVAFEREYQLKTISTEEQIVKREWIHRYNPEDTNSQGSFRFAATGVDVASSKADGADKTAMVSGRVYGYGKNTRVFILPHPVNEQLTFPETLERVKRQSLTIGKDNTPTRIFVEDVGYQRSLVQQLKDEDGFPAEGVSIHGQDKRSRLITITAWIETGRILFPEHGAEELITQILGFGSERHDDLVDALTILILRIMQEDNSKPEEPVRVKHLPSRRRPVMDWADMEDRQMLRRPGGSWRRLFG